MVNGSIGSGGRHVVGRLGEPVVLPVTRLITLSLTSSAWEGSKSPYYQKVSAGGVDARSKVDIMPPDAQSYETIFCGDNLCLIAENSGGELTVYAIGKKPLEDIVVKAAVTAVKGANGLIVGAAVGNISTGGDSPSCPVSSVNGKTGAVMLEAADVGARSSDWMPTAQEVGADSKGAAKTAVFAHDASTDSHSDIRLELKAIADRLTAFFDSDNQTLDELSEIVAYITDNKELIDSITTSKVSVVDVINNLTTNVVNKPLSAAQGVVLRGLITELGASLSNYQPKGNYAHTSDIPTKVSQLQNDSGYLTEHQDISGKLDATKLPEAINKALEQAKESGEFDGANGKSAYEAAVYNGFEGTEKEWLASLKGEDYVLTDADKAEIVRGVAAVSVAKNQGSENAGKILVVATDGNLTLADMPEGGASGDVIGTLDESNNILLTGNLADGTYTLKYENADGTYTEVGKLQVGELTVVSISAIKTKTTYTVGDTLNTDDITVTATYSDGSTKTVTDYTVDGSAAQMGVAGSYNLVISFGGASTTIAITVVAAEPAYTNLYVQGGDGYLEGGRCGSDGTDRTGTTEGQIVTNYIPVKAGDVVRTRGFVHLTGGSAYSGIYKADKTAIKGFYPTSSYTDCVTDITLNEEDKNLWAQFTIAHAEAGYIRLCCRVNPTDYPNPIITVNQEIV